MADITVPCDDRKRNGRLTETLGVSADLVKTGMEVGHEGGLDMWYLVVGSGVFRSGLRR